MRALRLSGEGGFARLRAGRSAALTRHWRVIHCRPPFESTDTRKNTAHPDG